MIPSGLAALVLVLGSFRITRLIGWDDLPPIAKLRARATGEWIYQDSTVNRDAQIVRYKRPILAHFLGCPYCLGFWVSLVVYVCWLIDGRWTLYGLAVFALSGAVGIVGRMLDP